MDSDIHAKAAELKYTPSGRVFVEYLKFELDIVKTKLILARNEMIPQLQGRAQQLTDLIKFLSEK
jgi:hypothetical protein